MKSVGIRSLEEGRRKEATYSSLVPLGMEIARFRT